MSKEYYCKQIIDLEFCGETNPENFDPGRYSSCKSCRKKLNKESSKKIRENARREKEMDNIEKIDNAKGNLGQNIRNLIVDTIHTYPIFEGMNILQRIEKREFSISEHMESIQNKFSKYDLLIENITKESKKIKEENIFLKNENEYLRKEIINIKRILQEKEIYDFNN